MKLPWTQTEIEQTLTNEPGQARTDGGMATGLIINNAERQGLKVPSVVVISQQITERWQKEEQQK